MYGLVRDIKKIGEGWACRACCGLVVWKAVNHGIQLGNNQEQHREFCFSSSHFSKSVREFCKSHIFFYSAAPVLLIYIHGCFPHKVSMYHSCMIVFVLCSFNAEPSISSQYELNVLNG